MKFCHVSPQKAGVVIDLFSFLHLQPLDRVRRVCCEVLCTSSQSFGTRLPPAFRTSLFSLLSQGHCAYGGRGGAKLQVAVFPPSELVCFDPGRVCSEVAVFFVGTCGFWGFGVFKHIFAVAVFFLLWSGLKQPCLPDSFKQVFFSSLGCGFVNGAFF